MTVALDPFSLDRMISAVAKVKERLLRATKALSEAHVTYAVVGGNAIAAWVARVDETAVRNTRDVDILVRRSELATVTKALESVGFIYRNIDGVDMFLDGLHAKARDAVHIIYSGEKVRENEHFPNPDAADSEEADDFRILSLEALVRIKLTAYRDKDRMHLRDLIDVGLVDDDWVDRLPNPLNERLSEILQNPLG